MIVKVHQKIKETDTKGQEKERIQLFEGTVIAVKHGSQAGATFTVRKVSDGVGVERIYPMHSPVVADVELVRTLKVNKAKAYNLRTSKKKLKEVKKERKAKVLLPKYCIVKNRPHKAIGFFYSLKIFLFEKVL
jgi:large subunit ribosomal protein L19